MGDTTDGSSSAAHSAQQETITEDGTRGLLSRVFGFSQPEDEDPAPSTGQVNGDRAAPQDMFGNLRRMQDQRVEELYVPKASIEAVEVSTPLPEIVEAFRRSGFTRLPVFEDRLDNPLGFLHLKDLALNYGFDAGAREFDIQPLIRTVLFAPPSMPSFALLQKMQASRVHIALVIDEYGGVDGLITIEDLLEQIVGEIVDEHDTTEAEPWIIEAPGVFLCQARTPLEMFEAEAGVDLLADDLDEEVDTLGGLVFMMTGAVPARGEVIVHPDGHEFEVVDADPRAIKRLRVRLKPAVLDRAAE
ncbi:hemolysin family protein [Oceanomicrobium pacificus]|uniref:CBS domain-containing protein n=1 Tax=Oceanomicrobium pacificus TaxID=2692916 RepID=A0A6B0TT84_9RHOB|nr:hemolysin family protein [Oceanomicrobium pacificus]MXU64442.1 CBS domain-containing protein [Oceanomicrobium pacificus]